MHMHNFNEPRGFLYEYLAIAFIPISILTFESFIFVYKRHTLQGNSVTLLNRIESNEEKRFLNK
jgi:hypothetical protein